MDAQGRRANPFPSRVTGPRPHIQPPRAICPRTLTLLRSGSSFSPRRSLLVQQLASPTRFPNSPSVLSLGLLPSLLSWSIHLHRVASHESSAGTELPSFFIPELPGCLCSRPCLPLPYSAVLVPRHLSISTLLPHSTFLPQFPWPSSSPCLNSSAHHPSTCHAFFTLLVLAPPLQLRLCLSPQCFEHSSCISCSPPPPSYFSPVQHVAC